MLSNTESDREAILAAYDEWEAAHDRVAALCHDVLTHPELLAVLGRREALYRRQPAADHSVIARLATEASPTELGGKNLADVLASCLRISTVEARRRIEEAQDLGPRTALSGEPLPPHLPNVAAAQADGQIGAEHIKTIRRFFAQLPDSVDDQTREAAEATLARVAVEHRPEGLRQAADRLAALLDPDGTLSDAERARRRHLTLGRQSADGMSELRGLLDPEARATLDAVLAKLAAPGMANPDDQTPCVDGPPSAAAVQTDLRSQPQRNHDAVKAMGRAMLCSGQLGQHQGLPATIIVSTTLKELASGRGQAVTGGGTLLPMSDVIRLASHAYHYLVVFNRHTEIPLYLGRTRRTASAGQRIVLHAKDRGCTRPGCTVPGYWCEVHHAETDWANEGQTNIDDLTLACGPDNRLVKPGGWKTRKRRKDGRTEWIPPTHLDTGQSRVNDYHHPQNYLVDPDEEADPE